MISKAIAALFDHPEWSNEQIAELVGCNTTYLSQNTRFRELRKSIKGIGQESRLRSKRHLGNDMDAYRDSREN